MCRSSHHTVIILHCFVGMALKPVQKINPEKNHVRPVWSCSNENSAHLYSQSEFQSSLTDSLTVNRTTMKPLGVYNASTSVPKHNVQVVTNETFSLMDDTFKPNYEELKNNPMPFMLPPHCTSYQTMAGDGVIQSSQLEDMSTSENDTSSTVGLEQAAGVERIGVEQLKVMSMCCI